MVRGPTACVSGSGCPLTRAPAAAAVARLPSKSAAARQLWLEVIAGNPNWLSRDWGRWCAFLKELGPLLHREAFIHCNVGRVRSPALLAMLLAIFEDVWPWTSSTREKVVEQVDGGEGENRMATHRPLSSSCLGLPYRIPNISHKKELLRGLWLTNQPTRAASAMPHRKSPACKARAWKNKPSTVRPKGLFSQKVFRRHQAVLRRPRAVPAVLRFLVGTSHPSINQNPKSFHGPSPCLESLHKKASPTKP